MKINPTGNINPVQGGYRAGKLEAYGKTQSFFRSDEASLSQEAVVFSKVMSSIRESAESASPEEASRIALIKGQVQTGEYRVGSDKIADSILGKR